jgi:hypothetical protein
MKAILFSLVPAAVLCLAGCTGGNQPPSKEGKPEKPVTSSNKEEKIKAALAKLSPEDRALAEEQKFCAVEDENPLGSMGKPDKVTIEGQTVFLCCAGCRKKALANPEKTLAQVKENKEKAKKEAAQ